MFLLNNQNIGARFLAKFFLTILRQRNPHYKSVVIPIRKDLGRQVFMKKRSIIEHRIIKYRKAFIDYRKEYTSSLFDFFRNQLKLQIVHCFLVTKAWNLKYSYFKYDL